MEKGQSIGSGAFAAVLLICMMLVVSRMGHFEYVATGAITLVVFTYLIYALLHPEQF